MVCWFVACGCKIGVLCPGSLSREGPLLTQPKAAPWCPTWCDRFACMALCLQHTLCVLMSTRPPVVACGRPTALEAAQLQAQLCTGQALRTVHPVVPSHDTTQQLHVHTSHLAVQQTGCLRTQSCCSCTMSREGCKACHSNTFSCAWSCAATTNRQSSTWPWDIRGGHADAAGTASQACALLQGKLAAAVCVLMPSKLGYAVWACLWRTSFRLRLQLPLLGAPGPGRGSRPLERILSRR